MHKKLGLVPGSVSNVLDYDVKKQARDCILIRATNLGLNNGEFVHYIRLCHCTRNA